MFPDFKKSHVVLNSNLHGRYLQYMTAMYAWRTRDNRAAIVYSGGSHFLPQTTQSTKLVYLQQICSTLPNTAVGVSGKTRTARVVCDGTGLGTK